MSTSVTATREVRTALEPSPKRYANEDGNGSRHVVARWRREQLTDSGFPLSVAARLAEDAGYDLHALIELVDRGCAHHLAARIAGSTRR